MNGMVIEPIPFTAKPGLDSTGRLSPCK